MLRFRPRTLLLATIVAIGLVLVVDGCIYPLPGALLHLLPAPSEQALYEQAQQVVRKFLAGGVQPADWSPTYRVTAEWPARWSVVGEVEGNLGSGKRAPHRWTATLQRIRIGRIACVQLELDGRVVLRNGGIL